MAATRRLSLPDIPPPPPAEHTGAADSVIKERLRAATEPLGFGERATQTVKARAGRNAVQVAMKSMQLIVPDYLFEEMGLSAVRRRVTKRYLILEALQKAGYTIHADDLDEDGRRRR
jgi:hypothetical protein